MLARPGGKLDSVEMLGWLLCRVLVGWLVSHADAIIVGKAAGKMVFGKKSVATIHVDLAAAAKVAGRRAGELPADDEAGRAAIYADVRAAVYCASRSSRSSHCRSRRAPRRSGSARRCASCPPLTAAPAPAAPPAESPAEPPAAPRPVAPPAVPPAVPPTASPAVTPPVAPPPAPLAEPSAVAPAHACTEESDWLRAACLAEHDAIAAVSARAAWQEAVHNDELYAVAVGVWQQAAALGVELYLYDTEGGLSVTRQPPPPPRATPWCTGRSPGAWKAMCATLSTTMLYGLQLTAWLTWTPLPPNSRYCTNYTVSMLNAFSCLL